MFTQVAYREGPHGRSLPLDLDGDIFEGLLGHSGYFVGLRLVVASCSCVVRAVAVRSAPRIGMLVGIYFLSF